MFLFQFYIHCAYFSQQINILAKNYSIKESLASLIETFLPYAQSKKQSIEFNCKCNGVVKLRADSFEKITSNILINALKYTQHQGRVEITASNENNTVHIKIKDNGPGIVKAQIPKIFAKLLYGSKSSMRIRRGRRHG